LVLPVSPAHERCTPVHLYGTRVIGLLDTILPPKNLSNRIVEAEANLASNRRVKAPPLDGMESTRERDPPVNARLDPAAGWGAEVSSIRDGADRARGARGAGRFFGCRR
jgi:hypothetical protein